MIADQFPEQGEDRRFILARQPHEPRQHPGHLYHAEPPLDLAVALDLQAEPLMLGDLFGNCGKGCAGSSASGVSTGRAWAR